MGKPSRQQPVIVRRPDGSIYSSQRMGGPEWRDTPTLDRPLTVAAVAEVGRQQRARALRKAARRG